MSASTPKSARKRRVLLIDARAVAEMLGGSVASVLRDHARGHMPAAILIDGEERWRVDEIRHWVREGCPDRTAWERRWYR